MPTATPPRGISVVVPVKGRVALMRALLESLATAMEQCPEPSEVVVVDDSGPDDAAAHRAHCEEFGARYVRGPRHVGAKRNLGVREARYDVVLFTDSDCRVTPGMLTRHVETLRRSGARVGGVAGPTFVEHGSTPAGRVMRWSRLINDDLERPGRVRAVTWATTTNLSVRRHVFEEVGGFPSESLDIVGGEDCDLGIKISDAGYTIACDPEAVARHDEDITGTLGTAARRLYSYGRSEQWVCSIHPHHRRPVVNAATVLAVTAAASLLWAPRSRGRSLAAPPAVLGLLVWRRARALRDPDRAPGGGVERLVCSAVELMFDLGGFHAALRLGRPSGLVTGLRPAERT